MSEGNFWRTEVWHALSVHFPIALLLFSTLTMLIAVFLKADRKRYWQGAGSILLFVGCLAAWISMYTGNQADGIVARKICDPTILKDHEIAAQTMTYLFTFAALLSLLLMFKDFGSRLKLISSYVIVIMMIVASGYLVYAGHLGASLVYQQGAGVLNHEVDCDD